MRYSIFVVIFLRGKDTFRPTAREWFCFCYALGVNRIFLIPLCLLAACSGPPDFSAKDVWNRDTLVRTDSSAAFAPPARDSHPDDGTRMADTSFNPKAQGIDTRGVRPEQIVAFAKTLIGTPYVYGSTNPKVGFDCSGFITHVFNHFNVKVPRSSIDFTGVGTTVDTTQARAGDLILFTGTNPQERDVGHMGIVVDNTDSLRFIHSTSGKQHGVTITALGTYYKTRFVRVARVFR